MDIYRMQKEAEDRYGQPEERQRFLMIGKFGVKEAKWLDAYFGMFQMEGQDPGTMTMVKQIADLPIEYFWCVEDADSDTGDPAKQAKS